jgi:hypothetical protein
LIEIGIARYENKAKPEPPHWHKQAFEFQYTIAGLTAYLNLITAEEHVFRKGDCRMCDSLGVVTKSEIPRLLLPLKGFSSIKATIWLVGRSTQPFEST